MEENQLEDVYMEHQYMCSECQQLFNTLEDVLVHQQMHTGLEEEEEVEGQGGETGVTSMTIQGISEMGESHYQCLECGALLMNPEELLLHQEMHMREAGMEVEEREMCEVLETEDPSTEAQDSGPVQYQCLDCLALFDTPESWLEHRETHSRSSTHSNTESTEYVLQADGSLTPLNSVQNYVLSEEQAGEILAQVLAQQQQQQTASKPAAPPRPTILPAVSPAPGSATMRLQILTAQALADGSTTPGLRRAKLLPPLLPALGPGASGKRGVQQNGLQRLEVRLAPARQQQQQQQMVVIHPYECSECALLFQTPEDFLQHQGEHFLGQDKESGEAGVMTGLEDEGRREEPAERAGAAEARGRPAERKVGLWAKPQQCDLCSRVFTSVNRLAAHKRVHEQGTYECPECDKVFKKATSLQTHMRTHSGEARFLCVDCGHGFTTEMTLMMHRKSHTPEPMHRCQYCSKTFSNMTKYLYHRRTHVTRDTPAAAIPVTLVPTAARRVSLSALSILQRAKARQEAANAQEQSAAHLAPLTEEEMEEGEATAAPSPQREAEAGAGAEAELGENHGAEAEAPSATGGEPQQGGEASATGPAATPPDGPGVEALAGPSVPATAAPAEGSGAAGGGGGGGAAAAGGGGGAFPCRACTKSFPSQLQLVRHRHASHAERRFPCGVCGKPFAKQIHVRNHLRTHTGERPYQCADCGKTFSSLANLTRHSLTHTGARPYRCEVCQRSFSQSSNLRQHSLLHANPTPLPCPDCPATFRWPARLAAHRYAQHPGAPAPFPCPHCPAGFLTRRQRNAHCLEEHPAPAPGEAEGRAGPGGHLPSGSSAGGEAAAPPRGGLDCHVCGKKLNSPANLRLHLLSHGRGPGRPRGGGGAQRVKSHQCSVCGKLFVSASGVALHQRVHTGERPFPCPVCGKRFRQNTHLREHLRTHSGERPFRCDICDKGFVQSMHLAEHRRTHTGERPHACPHCPKAFKTFSNLRNHKKTHARIQRLEEEEEGAEEAAATAAVETSAALALVDASAMELAYGQPQVIQIQASDLQQGTPTIMCNEFGETIAIIETSEGGALPLAEALEIYHTALENGLGMEAMAVDGLQIL